MGLLEDLVSNYLAWLTIVISGTIGGSLFGYFRSIRKCQITTKEQVDRLNKRTFRQSQAMLSMAHALDRQTDRYHPEENSEVYDEVDRTLRDEKGDL